MKPVAFAFTTASDAAESFRYAVDDGVKMIAGGQSLGPMLNLRLVRPTRVVDLSGASDLREVREEADAIIYGAAVTHAEIEDGAVPDATPGWLSEIARRLHIAQCAIAALWAAVWSTPTRLPTGL
jgi:carbon-monoxide dehydrogenase medium subunit